MFAFVCSLVAHATCVVLAEAFVFYDRDGFAPAAGGRLSVELHQEPTNDLLLLSPSELPSQQNMSAKNDARNSGGAQQPGKMALKGEATQPKYFSPEHLTVQPRFLSAPLFNVEGGAEGLVGELVLQITIDAEGRVVDVLEVKSALPESVSRAAVVAFRDVIFSPGEIDGRKVGVIIEVQFQYGGAKRVGE